jgi:5-formyltetrahydrofolate cyclo-ligase
MKFKKSLSPREAREEALALRRALTVKDVAGLSRVVVERFLKSRALNGLSLQGVNVALYQALPTELSLAMLEPVLLDLGARLFFPRIVSHAHSTASTDIEFVPMPLGADGSLWQEGPYGIREPHRDLLAVNPRSLGIILVPGSAYGLQGERVGMGRGYYDRFLARVPEPLRVALAYDFQLFDRIELNSWDEPVDWVITEKREVRTGVRGRS